MQNGPLPWILGAAGFGFIILMFLSSQKQRLPIVAPVFASIVSQRSSEEFTDPIEGVAVGPRLAPPAAPGKPVLVTGEWKSVAQFQGAGAARTEIFVIRARQWKLKWAAKVGSAESGEAEWYGPGADFKASIYSKSHQKVGTIANGLHQYSSLLPLTGEGKFYVEVLSPHNWMVTVEEWR